MQGDQLQSTSWLQTESLQELQYTSIAYQDLELRKSCLFAFNRETDLPTIFDHRFLCRVLFVNQF